MSEIKTSDDYDRLLKKWGDRVKVARAKYDDFKRELAVLERALGVPAPAAASVEARKQYDALIKSANLMVTKDLKRRCAQCEEQFESYAKTLNKRR